MGKDNRKVLFRNRKLYRLSVPAHEHDGLVSLQCLCLCLLVLVSLFHQDHLDALLHCVLLGFLDSAGFVRCQFGKGRPEKGSGVSPAEKNQERSLLQLSAVCSFGYNKNHQLACGQVKDPILFLTVVRLINRFKKFYNLCLPSLNFKVPAKVAVWFLETGRFLPVFKRLPWFLF